MSAGVQVLRTFSRLFEGAVDEVSQVPWTCCWLFSLCGNGFRIIQVGEVLMHDAISDLGPMYGDCIFQSMRIKVDKTLTLMVDVSGCKSCVAY